VRCRRRRKRQRTPFLGHSSKPAKSLVQNIQGEISVSLGDAHRRRETNRLTIKAALAYQQTQVTTDLQHLGAFRSGRFFRRAILHSLNAKEQAFAAHIANDIVLLLQALKASEKTIAYGK